MPGKPPPEKSAARRSWNSALFFVALALACFLAFNGIYTLFFVGHWDTFFYGHMMLAHAVAGVVFLVAFFAYIVVHLIETRRSRELLAYGGIIGTGVAIVFFIVLYSIRLSFIHPLFVFLGGAVLFLAILTRYLVKIVREKPGVAKKRERRLTVLGYSGFLAFLFGAVFGVMLYLGAGDVNSVIVNLHAWLCYGLLGLAFWHILIYAGLIGRKREGESSMVTVGSFLPGRVALLSAIVGLAGFLPIRYATMHEDRGLAAERSYATPKELSPLSPSNLHVAPEFKYANELIGASKSCGVGGCHIHLYRQWEMSAHRFSNNLFVQRVEELLASQAGAEMVKICAQCHAPVALATGEIREGMDYYSDAFKEGVSCVYCHAVTKRPGETGMGNLNLLPPRVYPYGEHTNELVTRLNTRIIEMKPGFHRDAFSKPFYKQAEFCGACHRIFIPEEINGVRRVLLADHQAERDEGPFAQTECIECHMPYFNDNKGNRRKRGHLMPGAQQGLAAMTDWAMSRYGNGIYPVPEGYGKSGFQELPARTFPELARDLATENERWMKGEVEIPELQNSGRWPQGRVLEMGLKAEGRAAPGETVSIVVETRNNKTGHEIPAHPQDVQQTWLEATAAGADGEIFFHSGAIGEDGRLDPQAHRLGIDKTDAGGAVLKRHEVWAIVGKAYSRVLKAGATTEDRFEIKIPAGTRFPVTIAARWNYRRANRDFADFVFEGSSVNLPVTTYSEEKLVLTAQ